MIRAEARATSGESDNITDLLIVIPANSTKTFSIDEVLATGDAGALNTRIMFQNKE